MTTKMVYAVENCYGNSYQVGVFTSLTKLITFMNECHGYDLSGRSETDVIEICKSNFMYIRKVPFNPPSDYDYDHWMKI